MLLSLTFKSFTLNQIQVVCLGQYSTLKSSAQTLQISIVDIKWGTHHSKKILHQKLTKRPQSQDGMGFSEPVLLIFLTDDSDHVTFQGDVMKVTRCPSRLAWKELVFERYKINKNQK